MTSEKLEEIKAYILDEKEAFLSKEKVLSILDCFKRDLERLEQIDNAKPSEALKSLEELRDFRYGENKLLVCQTEMYSIIKQALIKAQEQDKILEILKPRIYIEKGLYREDFQDDRLKFDKSFFDNAEQENTIKEWLEDEKENN